MADLSRTQVKRPRDLNQRAANTVARATGEEPEEQEQISTLPPELSEEKRHLAAVALGRRGGLKDEKARAAKLTPEERSESARKAAEARWNKE